jgi:hypothetical protein
LRQARVFMSATVCGAAFFSRSASRVRLTRRDGDELDDAAAVPGGQADVAVDAL